MGDLLVVVKRIIRDFSFVMLIAGFDGRHFPMSGR